MQGAVFLVKMHSRLIPHSLMYDSVYTVIDTAHSTFMGFTKKCKEVS